MFWVDFHREFAGDSVSIVRFADFCPVLKPDNDDLLPVAATDSPRPSRLMNNNDSADGWADNFGCNPSAGKFENQEVHRPLDCWNDKDKAE
jgi:hypothetical protein